jgi:hypothetical protein
VCVPGGVVGRLWSIQNNFCICTAHSTEGICEDKNSLIPVNQLFRSYVVNINKWLQQAYKTSALCVFVVGWCSDYAMHTKQFQHIYCTFSIYNAHNRIGICEYNNSLIHVNQLMKKASAFMRKVTYHHQSKGLPHSNAAHCCLHQHSYIQRKTVWGVCQLQKVNPLVLHKSWYDSMDPHLWCRGNCTSHSPLLVDWHRI